MALLPHWLKDLTPEMIKRAEVELGETSEKRKIAMEELRQLIDNEEGFCIPTDEQFLQRFLRAKKYEVKRAFKSLKLYYSLKASFPELLNILPSDVEHILKKDIIMVTTRRGLNAEGVLILLLGVIDDDWSVSAEDLTRATFISADIGVEAEASQICGSSMIFDLKGVTWRTLVRLSTPKILSLMAKGLQDAWPHRINGIHVVNEPSYFTYTYNIIRPMLSRKMRRRIHFHGKSLESLHKHFPVEILPEALGGKAGKKEFKEFRENILDREKLGEKLRDFVYEGVKFPEANSEPFESESYN
ncbi:retinaldehyde-binding protein 1-like [Argiope bruennichi]|uniref:Clavesin-2 like protein n=1 Tax=Argiope bruennichi TaxID=94029 RepID=A0A8T0EWG2_ARGBR|nr:retinaldehyde-binding protein 1-like [Argiope bruennichi]KAF8778369.1 Clavesin-2 like protein [Argiope bruennichi]